MLNLAAVANSIYALIRLFNQEADLAWAGVAIAGLAVSSYTLSLYRYRTPRTGKQLTGLSVIIAVGVGLSIAGTALGAADGWRAVIYSALMLVLWLLYVSWYSRLDRGQNNLLVVGKTLPSFSLQNSGGRGISSDSFRGQPALFMFYRGNWCPLCMAQIREVADQYRELAARGVQVVLISPQSHGHTRRLAQQFDVPFQFLVDVDNQAARQLRIAHENGIPAGYQVIGYDSETVFPTVIIIDASGKIILVDLTDNYRLRPEPQIFLRALDNHTGDQ
ncbi:MAG: redoxin domain-containing protein [Chloroflexi bacterium]|nr:redoxin domain-containing protein [Chloroflexota bacterium]